MTKLIKSIALGLITPIVYIAASHTTNPVLYALCIIIVVIGLSTKFILEEIKKLNK